MFLGACFLIISVILRQVQDDRYYTTLFLMLYQAGRSSEKAFLFVRSLSARSVYVNAACVYVITRCVYVNAHCEQSTVTTKKNFTLNRKVLFSELRKMLLLKILPSLAIFPKTFTFAPIAINQLNERRI